MRYLLFIKQLICSLIITIPVYSHAQQWRVISERTQQDTLAGSSIKYFTYKSVSYTYDYNANRGSSFGSKTIDFDEAEYSVVDIDNRLKPHHKIERVYNHDNSLFIEKELVNGGQVYRIDSFTYTNKKLTKHISHHGRNINKRSIIITYQYNAQGNLSVKNILEKGNLTPVYIDKHYYFYDVNNRLILDSLSRNIYSVWTFQRNIIREYDASGKIKEIKKQISTGYDYRQFLQYNAQGQLILDSTQNYRHSQPNVPHYYAVKKGQSYNSKGQLISYIASSRDNNKPKKPTRYDVAIEYTSFDYIKEITTTPYDSLGNQTNPKRVIYEFEHYWPVSVNHISHTDASLSLYPIPATHVLNINWAADHTTEITGSIINQQGQIVKQWNDRINGKYNKQIIVDELPTGSYLLNLTTGNKVISKRFVIVK